MRVTASFDNHSIAWLLTLLSVSAVVVDNVPQLLVEKLASKDIGQTIWDL